MAIFKKKAHKDREQGARSPTNSPPVQQHPSLTAAARDVSGSYAPPNANADPRRMTSQGSQQFPPPDRASMQTPTGRASPGPNNFQQHPQGYNLGMGLPSTMTGQQYPPPGSQMNGPPAGMMKQQQVSGQGPPISGQPMVPQTTGGPPMGSMSPNAQPQSPAAAPTNPSYPWTTHTLKLCQTTDPATGAPVAMSPFPRYGLSVPSQPSHSGHMLLFGGLVTDRAHNDLWSLLHRDASLQLVKTRGEAPLPRIGHISAISDKIMLVFGGDTKINEDDLQDDGLYALDLRTQEWTTLPVLKEPDTYPVGRYGHAACINGPILYVHGGHVDGKNFDDMWTFDIRQIGQSSGPFRWEKVKYNTPAPLARTGHTLVFYQNKLFLFGGTDGDYHYNDSWSFDIATGVWTELECIGYIPIPREGHAAAIVNDVVYVFGGRDVHGKDLGDLAAFRISNQRWYMFQNMGPAPMAKSGHSLCAVNGKVWVIGGESNLAPSVQRDNPNMVHVLDTTKIKYPVDNQSPGARLESKAAAAPRTRTTSDATDVRPPGSLAPVGPYGAGALAGAPAGFGSRSHDNLPRTTSPPELATEPRPLIIANDTGSISQHSRGSASQDSGPPGARANGIPPLRPRREGDEEFRRGMSPPEVLNNGTPNTSTTSPTNESRVVTPNDEMIHRSGSPPPPGHVASHTVHPNLRNTRSPPPELRVGENGRPALPPDAFYFGGKSPQGNSRPGSMLGRPGSLLGRPGSIVGNRPGSIAGTADLMREIKARETEADNAKRREAALRVILNKAIQQGYVVNDTEADHDLLEPIPSDNEQLHRIASALVQLKQDKANLQNEVATQMRQASDKLQEHERMQKSAMQEAAFYRAKLTALENGNGAEVHRLEVDRIAELEKQLETTGTDYEGTEREMERLKAELSRHQELSTTATANEEDTVKRADAAEEELARLREEHEGLRNQFSGHERTIRDHSERFITLSSTQQQREAERDQYKEQLDDALSKHSEYILLIEEARTSIAAAGARSTELEGLHNTARGQVATLEQQLLQARQELDAKSREAETATARLAEVETAHNTTRDEANGLRSMTNGRLGELLDMHRARGEDGTRSLKGHQDQLRALEEEKSSLLKLLRDAGERVDATEAAAVSHREKARSIESDHQALRADMRVHRTKLVHAQRDLSKYRDLFTAKDAELRDRDLAVTELQTRVGLLRKVLGENGINVTDSQLENAEMPNASALESKLRDKSRAHDNTQRENEQLAKRCDEAEAKVESLSRLVERMKDARSPSAASMRSPSPAGPAGGAGTQTRAVDAERKLVEVEEAHQKRLTALQSDYEIAVRYVKSTEKMLKRMKDELHKQKATNTTLLTELDGLRGRPGSVDPHHTGMRSLSGRNTPSDGDVQRKISALQHQYTTLQAELQASQDTLAARNREFDLLRSRSDEADRENELLREDLAQAQHRIGTLLEMNQSGINLASDDEDERLPLNMRRGSSASSDGGTSMAFDKFTKELKQWERARSPDAEAAAMNVQRAPGHGINGAAPAGNNNPFTNGSAHHPASTLPNIVSVGDATHERNSSTYSGDWTQ